MEKAIDFIRPISSLGAQQPLEDISVPYRNLLAAWLIELALMLGWARKSSRHELPDLFLNSEFRRLTGVRAPVKENPAPRSFLDPDYPLEEVEAVTTQQLESVLKQRLGVISRRPVPTDLPLFQNIATIGCMLELTAAEKALLLFAVMINGFRIFQKIITPLNEPASPLRISRIVSRLSGQPEATVLEALDEKGPLVASGILSLREGMDLERAFDLMEGLSGFIFAEAMSEARLLEHFTRTPETSELELGDYRHLERDTALLVALLRRTMEEKTVGVNILFHGIPGVGKTELVKVLAAALGADLHEVAHANTPGKSVAGSERLRTYALCQRLLARRSHSLLLFDEVEDVFGQDEGFMRMLGAKPVGPSKAWINRTLEQNPVPAIWVTNDPEIDPAYLRRFDYSVCFRPPVKGIREAIARRYFEPFAPDAEWIGRIAASEAATPAQYEKAARVAGLVAGNDPAAGLRVAELVLDRSARLLGQHRPPEQAPLHTAYDLALVNADRDLERLVEGLSRSSGGSICFYGPPGTGKSAFVGHLADRLGRPLVVRRASDLLDKYVGETEKRIAAMFEEAREQDAVLLLDEADSFLADRQGASRQWEVTQVNELLTQMERFDGLFCCTTNLARHLDPASLRRFLFKVKFDYLTPPQRVEMFRRELRRLGWERSLNKDWESRLCQLDTLTPGDFAVVVRQARLLGGRVVPGQLLEELRRECDAKTGGRRPIGFVH